MDNGLVERGSVGSQNRSEKSFGSYLGPLLLLTSIFFINFIARIIQAPLLPNIEKDLGLTHTAAASLFLSISSGYFVTLIGSGFISCRLQHRGTIILSIVALGAALFGTALTRGVFGIRIGLFGLGVCLTGCFILAGAFLTCFLKFSDKGGSNGS